MAILNGHEVAISKPSFNTRNGTLDISENGEFLVETYEKVAVEVSGGGGIQGGYTVTFKVDGDDYYIVSCQQGESITEPPVSSDNLFYKWKDANDNNITFPYTPNANIELYGTALYNGTLLLHCDDFTDSGRYQMSLTNNGVDIDTTIKKFGTGSWHFVEGSDYVKVDNPSTIFDFANNDFTIDLWLYPTAFTGGIFGAWSTIGQGKSFLLSTAGTAGLLFAFGVGSQATIVQTGNNVLTLNTWQHIAVTRHSDTIYIFVNGILVKSQNIGASTSINVVGSNNILVGKNGDTTQVNDHTTGYIDEIRILNGTCAWTENFTPPTQPY